MGQQKFEYQGRIAWGITGAGHFLHQCLDILKELKAVDVFISRAGREVLRSYGLLESLTATGHRLYWDHTGASRPVTGLYRGYYRLVVIAPATSNSVAKMAWGIADSLVTNLFAHAGKCRVPVIILPTDMPGEEVSVAPGGIRVQLLPRPIDVGNISRLATWPGVTIAPNPLDLKNLVL
ncbi:flavoprotein [Moorella sp. Hama-1]|uniref:flavoprotein n=1 Tax=Moorella sp. Hama-1 TaxID=2138101 RepID=UPI000D647309|nr:flavoprotein [Moorella sp. Hama-1]BCV21949.1 flavoprotein [Moorella sp. Hama-1]